MRAVVRRSKVTEVGNVIAEEIADTHKFLMSDVAEYVLQLSLGYGPKKKDWKCVEKAIM